MAHGEADIGKVFISVSEFAKVTGLSHQRARRWLKREGVAVKHMGDYYTTPDLMRRAFPEAADRVLASMLSRDEVCETCGRSS